MGTAPLRPVQHLLGLRQPGPEQAHQQATGLGHRHRDQLRLGRRLFFGGSSASLRTAARTAWASSDSVIWRGPPGPRPPPPFPPPPPFLCPPQPPPPHPPAPRRLSPPGRR